MILSQTGGPCGWLAAEMLPLSSLAVYLAMKARGAAFSGSHRTREIALALLLAILVILYGYRDLL